MLRTVYIKEVELVKKKSSIEKFYRFIEEDHNYFEFYYICCISRKMWFLFIYRGYAFWSGFISKISKHYKHFEFTSYGSVYIKEVAFFKSCLQKFGYKKVLEMIEGDQKHFKFYCVCCTSRNMWFLLIFCKGVPIWKPFD